MTHGASMYFDVRPAQSLPRKNSISQPATVDYPGGYLISQVLELWVIDWLDIEAQIEDLNGCLKGNIKF